MVEGAEEKEEDWVRCALRAVHLAKQSNEHEDKRTTAFTNYVHRESMGAKCKQLADCNAHKNVAEGFADWSFLVSVESGLGKRKEKCFELPVPYWAQLVTRKPMVGSLLGPAGFTIQDPVNCHPGVGVCVLHSAPLVRWLQPRGYSILWAAWFALIWLRTNGMPVTKRLKQIA